ncbi:Coatomer protein [Mycena sanguinolenta]|uniref:Coatomer protein n=1 Tax=Mycena sanguinolenta TaxID=230812 RepID=A0A8H6Z1V8_9AGAR|nr:Coatomer protein [Mycena sanguinolenta]
MSPRPQWPVTRLEMIMGVLGDRAKNSILMGAFLWIQLKYCHRDDSQLRRRRILKGVPSSRKPPKRPAASSQIYPLGRSLDELRLHGHGSNWSNVPHPHLAMGFIAGDGGDKDAFQKRAKTDGDGDSSSKNGGASGRLGESLPSLKSSGLLDSWNSATPSTHSRMDMRELSAKPSSAVESDFRMTTISGMPVGLQWLANESR